MLWPIHSFTYDFTGRQANGVLALIEPSNAQPAHRPRWPMKLCCVVYQRCLRASLVDMRTEWVDARWVAEGPEFSPGSVCWIDLSTLDPAASRDFYAGLFGWIFQIHPVRGREQYMTALCRGRPVAGVQGTPMRAGSVNAWTLYLASANVWHTAQVLGRWGGRVLYGPANFPGQGRVLVGEDPTGAVIGFWQPAPRAWEFHTSEPEALFWAELDTWDGMRADGFFAALFGYRQEQIGDGIDVDYTTWSGQERSILGRLQMSQDWAEPDCAAHWVLHFAVDPRIGTDLTADRVLDLGGRVDVDPYDTELGRIARVTDPCGATFALIDPTDRAEIPVELAAGPARVDDPYDD